MLTDLEDEFMVTSGEGWRGGIDWEFGIDMYTLLYLNNKDLLYSTGKYVQYHIYIHIYIYIKLNHFAVHLKHCKSTILQLKKKYRG